jgi:UDP-N-acetylmuramate dehydrogenase
MIFEELKKQLPVVERNILLKDHTTFNIGGPAEYFLLATQEKEILHAIKIAKELKIAVFVMGGGSNLLVSDRGIKGLVIKNQVKEPIVLLEDAIVEAPAGIVLGKVVDFSISNSLEGLEWAGGLPGTFGGGIRGNAGAFGGEIKDTILNVRALDNELNLKTLSNTECEFAYRTSIFKRKNWIVLSASVKLKKGDKKSLKEIADSRINYRKEKHPLEYPNAGSVFKNIAVKDLAVKFQKEFADKVKQDPFPIVPAAWFIIGAGLAGKQIGQAQISKKHSNYIVNIGNAKASDVLALIDLAKASVKAKYGIDLEMEVQFLGE